MNKIEEVLDKMDTIRRYFIGKPMDDEERYKSYLQLEMMSEEEFVSFAQMIEGQLMELGLKCN